MNGIPILINEEKSIFRIKDFLNETDTTFDPQRIKLKTLAKKFLPSISKNLKAKQNYKIFTDMLLTHFTHPRVLVIGGGIPGDGMEPLLNSPVQLVETDVSLGPRTKIVADAHNLPFRENSFDGVVVQAVLEHVINPYQCVAEITRVLKTDGYVYAETPFMQQVHMAPYDFTRFTYLGHRFLFDQYDVLESGSALGPGSALAWSYMYFLMSFTHNKWIKYVLMGWAHLTGFWLKYFDYYLIEKEDALDAASGYYFIFQKRHETLSHNELLKSFKGGSL